MRHATLDVIHEEHQALAAMLSSMSLLVMQAHRAQRLPEFGVLRAMLLYLEEFPERLHHRKESELLFPKLRARCPDLAPVLDQLDQEHDTELKKIRELQHAMLAFEVLGEPRRAAFEQMVTAYMRSYLDHMGVEESKILPAARTHLQPEDWTELDAAFSANRDPLAGHKAAPDYEPLFRQIVMQAPAPVGLGPAST